MLRLAIAAILSGGCAQLFGIETTTRPAGGSDVNLSCNCTGATLACDTGMVDCALGCMDDQPGAHCLQLAPSNALPLGALGSVSLDVVITGGDATFNTDTGEIAGVVTRAAVDGNDGGIAFSRVAGIGVFSMHGLTVANGAAIRFTGANAVAFVIATTAQIDGAIDGTGGCEGTDPKCAGPGGGSGGTMIPSVPASGCSPGGPGMSAMTTTPDAGGAGGGGGTGGGAGGASGAELPGAATSGCIAPTLEPLIGGSGGGAGGAGGTTTSAAGGGGGGAIQVTALVAIVVTGVINMGGAGGGGGPPGGAPGGGAAGCGGGAGGGVLLESPSVVITGVVAANGGGGGGGGSGTVSGLAGTIGLASAAPASGGGPAPASMGLGAGGAGGALEPAMPGGDSAVNNAGGGGGGAGAIYVRAAGAPQLGGTISPPAGIGAIRTQ